MTETTLPQNRRMCRSSEEADLHENTMMTLTFNCWRCLGDVFGWFALSGAKRIECVGEYSKSCHLVK